MPCNNYTANQINNIKIIYIISILSWLILIFILNILPPYNLIEFIILFIPVIVFMVSYLSVDNLCDDVDDYFFKNDILSTGIIIAVPLIIWIHSNSKNKSTFTKILITALILSLLSLINIWIPHDSLPYMKHIRSVLQTMSIILFMFALYRYFLEKVKIHGEYKDEIVDIYQ